MNHAARYQQVVSLAAQEYSVAVSDITGDTRRYEVIPARHAVSWILREVFEWDIGLIARFSCRKSDTIAYQVDRVNDWPQKSVDAVILFRVRDRLAALGGKHG